MASTITASTLTVSISEDITLGGTQFGGTKTLSVASIKEVFKRIVRCVDDTDCTIATFQTATNTADNILICDSTKFHIFNQLHFN